MSTWRHPICTRGSYAMLCYVLIVCPSTCFCCAFLLHNSSDSTARCYRVCRNVLAHVLHIKPIHYYVVSRNVVLPLALPFVNPPQPFAVECRRCHRLVLPIYSPLQPPDVPICSATAAESVGSRAKIILTCFTTVCGWPK